MVIRADLGNGHTAYDVTDYFRSAFIEVRKTAENAATDGFGSNFNGAAFCLAQSIGRLFKQNAIRRFALM